MAKHGIKQTDEILDFDTVEDFALIRSEYKQKQQVRSSYTTIELA